MSHAIVTGGSSGIGLAIAQALRARGDRVTLVASRPEPLAAAAAALGGETQTQAVDVRDAAAVGAAMAAAEATFGPCDLLITSAGVARPGRFEAMEAETFRRLMEVNYIGTVNSVRAVYPGMVARRQGRIGMIGSAASLLGIFGHTAYAPTKFAVRGFAEALRAEAKPHGIAVSICYPPDTDTPQLAAEAAHKPPETVAISGAAKIWQPEDVARLTIEGIDAGRFGIYPGLEIRALARLGSLVHPFLDLYFDQVVRRVQRR